MTARNRVVLQELRPHVRLCRDPKTGIAWIEDGTTGTAASCHSNISDTGSVRGMKMNGGWRQRDRTVRSHGFIFNIDTVIVHNDDDRLAAQHCQCGGQHG
jgi:hypothetical protein